MVVLIYPMFSNRYNLNADSAYIFIKRLINGILTIRKDWYFLYCFPNNLGWRYMSDGFFDNPNIIRIPMNIPTNKKEMVVNFPVETWKSINQKYAYDCFINNTSEITASFLPQFQAVTKEGTPFIINQHHYVIHSDLPYAMVDLGDKGIALLQLAGAMAAHVNVFNSKNCKKMLDDNFKKYYNTEKPIYKARTIYFGLANSEFSKSVNNPKSDIITFVYNHRFQSYKNWRETFELFDELYLDGLKFKVLVSSIDKNSVVEKKPYVILPNKLLKHDEYLDYISRGHINMLNSQHETFCYSVVESMFLKQAIIAPRKATFTELLGEDYPYIFENKKDQMLKARELILDKEKAIKVGEDLEKRAKELFSEERFALEWVNLIEGNIDDKERVKQSLKKKDRADQYFEKLPKEIPARVFFNHIRTWIGADQAFPVKKLKTIANAYGYKDKFVKNEQYFYK